MRPRRGTRAMSLWALLVLCLVVTTAAVLVPSIPATTSLTTKWVKQVYTYYGSAVVADVDSDAKPEILINSVYSVHCLNGMGDLEWERNNYGFHSTTPAVADIDGDGRMEIVVAGDSSRRLFCLDSSGVLKWIVQSTVASFSDCSPTAADIDQDGKPEILVGSDVDINGTCKLFCINGFGNVEWSYLTGSPVSTGSLSSSPTVADIQGDGRLEVVVTGGNNTYCLSEVGASVWNFTAPGGALFSPAVTDVEGDGKREVIVGHEDGNVYCLNASGVPKWNFRTGSANYLSPVSVADIDGDGKPEICFSTKGIFPYNSSMIYCLNGTGALKWRYATGGALYGPPVAANVDLDSDLEVVFGTSYSSMSGSGYDGLVYCLNSSGRVEWIYATGYYSLSNPLAVADVDLDGKPEIIVPTYDTIYCLSAFPELQAPIPGSVLMVLLGLASALIVMTAVAVVRRSRGVQRESSGRHPRSASRQRR